MIGKKKLRNEEIRREEKNGKEGWEYKKERENFYQDVYLQLTYSSVNP